MFTRREFTLSKAKIFHEIFAKRENPFARATCATFQAYKKNTTLPAFRTMSAEGHAHTAENAIFPAFGTFACDVRAGCKRKFTCVPPLRCARCPQRVVHSLDAVRPTSRHHREFEKGNDFLFGNHPRLPKVKSEVTYPVAFTWQAPVVTNEMSCDFHLENSCICLRNSCDCYQNWFLFGNHLCLSQVQAYKRKCPCVSAAFAMLSGKMLKKSKGTSHASA